MGFECSSNIPTSKRFLSAKTLDVINVTIAEQPISPCIIFFYILNTIWSWRKTIGWYHIYWLHLRLGNTTFIDYTLDHLQLDIE